MPAVPLLRPREVVRAFERLGWQVARQRGSHIVLTKSGAVATGTLRGLIARAGLTVVEFLSAVG